GTRRGRGGNMDRSHQCPLFGWMRSGAWSLVFVLVMMAAGLLSGRPVLGADLAGGGSAASCKPAYPQAGSSCSEDSQCCSGLVCQSGACRPGCRIGGAYRASGAANPSNACQVCQPSSSTTSWTTAADGSACSDGNLCTRIDSCQNGLCVGSRAVSCSAQD